MNQLTVINQSGQLLVDSREVAEMIRARHADLLEKINGYVSHLTNGKFRSLDFFIPSTYQDSKGETRPCYLLTRKGCDMVANKMTGEKGVLFTAAYVTKFEEMERQLQTDTKVIDSIDKVKRAEAMLINANVRKASFLMKMADKFKEVLSMESVQLLLAGAAEATVGKPLLPKPQIDVTFTATEIADEIGISANKIGRLTNKNGLKTNEYGIWVLDKSAHSDKQISSFLYNQKGRNRLIELIETERLVNE